MLKFLKMLDLEYTQGDILYPVHAASYRIFSKTLRTSEKRPAEAV